MSSSSYQPLADCKSEILGCRSPPPQSSWWARSSTTHKLAVVGGVIATSLLVLGVGMNQCLKHETLPSSHNHLVARSHPRSAPTYTTTPDDDDDEDDDNEDDDLPATTAAATLDPVATIAAIITSVAPTIAAASTVPASGSLWQPPVKATWQIILNHVLDVSALEVSVAPDVDVFDIDLFDNPKETFDALKKLNKKSICYFSAGSYEPGRPDSADFKPEDKGLELQGWPGEYWLNLNSANVRSIMEKRIALAATKGCDAIDPDNIDAYDNENGLGMTQTDSINYIKFLSETAAKYNISTGLKNGGSILSDVMEHVHFCVNEQCAQYDECGTFGAMINAGKPVFHVEYPKEVDLTDAVLCNAGEGFSTVLKNLDLDGFVQVCLSGITATTKLLVL